MHHVRVSCCLLRCREIDLLKLLQKFVTCNGTPVSSMQRRVLVRFDAVTATHLISGPAVVAVLSPTAEVESPRIDESGIEALLFQSCTCLESLAK